MRKQILVLFLALFACAPPHGKEWLEARGEERFVRLKAGPSQSSVYEVAIETFYQPEDGTSWTPAFERVQRAYPEGMTVRLACVEYRIESPIHLCTALRIEGCGNGRALKASKLYAANRTTIFFAHARKQCPWDFDLDESGQAIISHVWMDAPGGTGATPFFGVHAETRVRLDDVAIRHFVHGVHVSADTGRYPPTNANGWLLRDVDVDYSEHAGIWVEGGDANRGKADGGRSDQNCRKASKWTGLVSAYCATRLTEPGCTANVRCAGVMDFGFLGNRWDSIGGSTNKDVSVSPAVPYPAFVLQHPSQRSTGTGLYAEGDQPPSYFSQNDTVVGGLSNWTGAGMLIQGRAVNGMVIQNRKDASNITETRFGDSAASGTALEIALKSSPFGGSSVLRLKGDPGSKSLRFNVANIATADAFRIYMVEGAALPLGGLRLPNKSLIDTSPEQLWCHSGASHSCSP